MYEGTETVLNDRVTAQYTHTLTVTEATSFNGTYSCTVSNNKPSSASITVNTAVVSKYGNSGYSIHIVIKCTIQLQDDVLPMLCP